MKYTHLLLMGVCVLPARSVFAQVPQLLNYQGRVSVAGPHALYKSRYGIVMLLPFLVEADEGVLEGVFQVGKRD